MRGHLPRESYCTSEEAFVIQAVVVWKPCAQNVLEMLVLGESASQELTHFTCTYPYRNV